MPVVLPHTGLTVPHGDLAVTALDALSDLSAYDAVLSLKGHPIGSIVDQGRGGGAHFWPLTPAHLEPVHAFVTAARRGGEPVTDEEVYDDLVREYDMERLTQRANHLQQTVARGFSSGGSIITFVILNRPPGRFTRSAARQLAAETPQVTLWEIWTGEQWAAPFPGLAATL